MAQWSRDFAEAGRLAARWPAGVGTASRHYFLSAVLSELAKVDPRSPGNHMKAERHGVSMREHFATGTVVILLVAATSWFLQMNIG